MLQDNDDDGENLAGSRMAHLLMLLVRSHSSHEFFFGFEGVVVEMILDLGMIRK